MHVCSLNMWHVLCSLFIDLVIPSKGQSFLSYLYEFDWLFVYLNVSCLIFWSAILEQCTENCQWPPVIFGSGSWLKRNTLFFVLLFYSFMHWE